MFPLYDSSPKNTFPLVNYVLIILNIFIFYIQVSAPSFEKSVLKTAFIPLHFNIVNFEDYGLIISSMFMHGDLWHILSNLWFLHIFGDNVEDRMGHVGYAIFYIIGGIVATLTQYMLDPFTSIPIIGASGAISAVAGVYFLLYRNSKIKSLILSGYYVTSTDLPVWLFLGYWFGIQLISGLTTFNTLGNGGIAWFAHIGGFVFGLIIALLLRKDNRAHVIIND